MHGVLARDNRNRIRIGIGIENRDEIGTGTGIGIGIGIGIRSIASERRWENLLSTILRDGNLWVANH